MITIIDYNSGNLGSVVNSLEKLGIAYEVTADPQKILNANKIILPGVGCAAQAMAELRLRGLTEVIPKITQPFLGICIGLQLLASFSGEDDTKCLDIIFGTVKKFSPQTDLKIPQIGWNQVNFMKQCPLFDDIPNESYFYFVNSYYFDAPDECVLASTPYGIQFPSIIKKDNFHATQFHPEKSGEVGLKLLRNFYEKC